MDAQFMTTLRTRCARARPEAERHRSARRTESARTLWALGAGLSGRGVNRINWVSFLHCRRGCEVNMLEYMDVHGLIELFYMIPCGRVGRSMFWFNAMVLV